jgi:hypothetical protein
MAAPHVSGVAALVWSYNPNLTNAQIRDAMVKSAQDLGAAGRDNSYGYGLVQAYSALQFLGYTGGGPTPTPTVEPTPTETSEPTPEPTPTATPAPTGSLVVSVSTDKDSYTNRENVVITVKVTDGASNVDGASVTITILTPKSKQYSGTGTTDNNGNATFNFKVNSRADGTGTYTVTATASKSGYTSGTGSKTFLVN